VARCSAIDESDGSSFVRSDVAFSQSMSASLKRFGGSTSNSTSKGFVAAFSIVARSKSVPSVRSRLRDCRKRFTEAFGVDTEFP